MKNKDLIYEGKAKKLFAHEDNDKIIQFFKDDATAFNKKKHEVISEKGILNNLISEYIFKYLKDNGIDNHFIERLNNREQLIKKVEIIPVEVIIRNIATGTLSKRLGVKEGLKLNRPLVEFTLKSDELDDPILSEEHIDVLGYASDKEINDIKNQGLIINDLLSNLFASINIKLVDFKIEFGRINENKITKIILADEISPDSCRLWDKSSSENTPSTSTTSKSENTFHFERVWVDEQLADFGQLLNDARVIPTKKDGQPYFMFQYIKKESIYEQLGLKPKDIILEINGFVVDTVDKALKLLEVLQSEREIALMVEREGNPVKFHYYID